VPFIALERDHAAAIVARTPWSLFRGRGAA
jgi:hypothetical protein